MKFLRSLKHVRKAEIKTPEQSIPARTRPPAAYPAEPVADGVLRAAAQEFGTGLRSRLGAGDDGICW